MLPMASTNLAGRLTVPSFNASREVRCRFETTLIRNLFDGESCMAQVGNPLPHPHLPQIVDGGGIQVPAKKPVQVLWTNRSNLAQLL